MLSPMRAASRTSSFSRRCCDSGHGFFCHFMREVAAPDYYILASFSHARSRVYIDNMPHYSYIIEEEPFAGSAGTYFARVRRAASRRHHRLADEKRRRRRVSDITLLVRFRSSSRAMLLSLHAAMYRALRISFSPRILMMVASSTRCWLL